MTASDDNGVKFAYNDQEIAQVAKDACETYQKYASADETYNYVIEAGEDAGVSENEIEAVKSFRNIGDECGEFKDFTPLSSEALHPANIKVTANIETINNNFFFI